MPVMKIRTDCTHCGKSAEYRTDPAAATPDPGTGNLIVRLTCPNPACGKQFPFPLNSRRRPPPAPTPKPEVLELPDDDTPPRTPTKGGRRRTGSRPTGRPVPPPPAPKRKVLELPDDDTQ